MNNEQAAQEYYAKLYVDLSDSITDVVEDIPIIDTVDEFIDFVKDGKQKDKKCQEHM